MTPERWHHAREILESALDRPAAERDALVAEACGGDDELRRTVGELLAQSARDEFLDPPLPAAAHALLGEVEAEERVGTRVGRYRVESVVAVGGMGTVYRAAPADGGDDRPVALKLIRPGMCTDEMRRRFHRERRLLANLDHPSITRLLDGGTTDDGAPFLVMEFVHGERIDRWCESQSLSIDERLALFRRICAAVHFAHQNLVVHRDLKPSNVLVTPSGEPKLLDFGIAKLLAPPTGDRTPDATLTAALAMTPEYSSPEQIRGEPITTASDVYALGVILYELLAGARPYRLEPGRRFEAERIVCEVEPPRPSAVATTAEARRRLRGDLDNIVRKAMSKDPRGRYASADELSADVGRFLEGAPVLAHPPSRAYVLAKLVRRRPLGVAAALAIFGLVAAFAVSAALFATRLDHERRDAIAARERESAARRDAERVSAFMQDLLGSASPYQKGGEFTVLELLGEAGSRVEREFADQPAVAAGIHLTIANTYVSLWMSRRAEPHLRRAVDLYRTLGESRRDALIEAMGQLGIVLGYEDSEEGLAVAEEAATLARSQWGTEDARTAFALHVRAFALFRCAHPPRFEEAEAAFAEVLPLQRRLHGSESYVTARCLHTMAALERHRGRAADAERLYRESLDLYRRTIGEDNLGTIECRSDYGRFLREQGRVEEARSMLEACVASTRRRVGERWTAPLLAEVARCRRQEGELEEAEALCRRALVLQIQGSAPRRSELEIASRLRELPDAHESYGALVRVWNGMEIASPSDALDLASILVATAGVLEAEDDSESAAGLLREDVRIQSEAYPPSHWRVAVARTRLAACLARCGRADEAAALAESASRAVVEALGPEDPAAVDALASRDAVRRARAAR
jgi:eukaryotic-like serine/threonine-protein kinase